jgi:hypothetical protein
MIDMKIGENKITELQMSVLKTSINTIMFSAYLCGKESDKSFNQWEKDNDVCTNTIGLILEILNAPHHQID